MAASQQTDIQILIQEAVERSGDLEKLVAEIKALGGDATVAEKQAAALTDQLAGLTRQQTVIEVFRQMSAAAEQAAQALAEQAQRAGDAESKQAALTRGLEASRQALAQVYQAQAELSSQTQRSAVETKAAADRLAGLTAESKSATQATAALNAQLRGEAAEVTAAQRALTASETALQRNQQAIAGLESRLAAAREAQRGLTNQVVAAEAPTDALAARHEAATAKVQLLEVQLATARARTGELQAATTANAAAMEAAQRQYQATGDATKAAAQQVDAYKAQVAAAREQLTASKQGLKEQETALRDNTRTAKELETAIAKDEIALRAQTQAVEQSRTALQAQERAQAGAAEQQQRGANAMRYAGLDAANLAGEQARVTRETINTSSATSELKSRLAAETEQLRQLAPAASTAAAESKSLGNAQQEAAEKSGGFTKAIGDAAHSAAKWFGISAIFNEAKDAIEDILKTGDQFEVYQKQLDATFGSAAKGEAAFAWAKTFAKNTPLELKDVIVAMQQLKNYGLDPMDGSLQALTDQTAKLGGGQEKLNQIILAAGQAYAKGRLQGQELLQFANAGVPVFDLLSKTLGKSTEEVLKMSEAGTIGRDKIRALIAAIGSSSTGAAADQMSTLTGRVSNLKDVYDDFLVAVANNGPMDLAKETLAGLTEEVDGSASAARILGQTITSAGQLILTVFSLIGAQFLSFRVAFDAFAGAAAQTFAVIADGLSRITPGAAGRAFADAADALYLRAQELDQDLAESANAIASAYGNAWDHLKASGSSAYEVVTAAAGQTTDAAAAAGQAIAKSGSEADAALNRFEKTARDQAEAIANLKDEAKALGIDYAAATTKIDEATTKQLDAFRQLATNAQATAPLVRDAFTNLLNGAQTKEEAAAVANAIKDVSVAGFDAAGAIAKIKQRMNELPAAAESVDPLVQALKRLGVTSQQELDRAATAATNDFNLIQTSGVRSVSVVAEAFGKMAEAQLKAAAAAGDIQLAIEAGRLRAQAATQAEQQALDGLIAKYPQLATAADEASAHQVAASERAGQSLDAMLARIKALHAASSGAGDAGAAAGQLTADGYTQAEHAALLAQEAIRGTTTAFEEHSQRAGETATELAQAILDLRQKFVDMGTTATAEFDAIERASLVTGESVGDFIDTFNSKLVLLNQRVAEQQSYAQSLTEKLGTVGGQTATNIKLAEQLAATNKYLGSEQLSSLNAALAQARSNLSSLRNDAAATLESVREQLYQLNGDYVALAQAQGAAKLQDLEAKLSAAKAAGDRTAIDQYQQAIALQNQVNAASLNQAKQQQTSASSTTTSTTSTATTGRFEIALTLNGSTYELYADSQSQAEALILALQRAQQTSNGGY